MKVVVTSRMALHIRAEHEFIVPPLAVPTLKQLPDIKILSHYEAVALFLERAQTTKPDFSLTNTNAPIIAAICAHLDGLPLAIELAAARVKHFSPHTLLTRLEQGLSVLSGGARDLPARQQTLREFGLEQLAKDGELEAARLAHAEYYLRLAEEVGPTLQAIEQGRSMAHLQQEHENLRAALSWLLVQAQGGASAAPSGRSMPCASVRP
jgi:predicted ATPase